MVCIISLCEMSVCGVCIVEWGLGWTLVFLEKQCHNYVYTVCCIVWGLILGVWTGICRGGAIVILVGVKWAEYSVSVWEALVVGVKPWRAEEGHGGQFQVVNTKYVKWATISQDTCMWQYEMCNTVWDVPYLLVILTIVHWPLTTSISLI